MPFYRYSCLDCGFDESVFVQIGEKIKNCPKCSSENIQKKIGKIIANNTSDSSKSKSNIDKFIKDSREDLKLQKSDLKSRSK